MADLLQDKPDMLIHAGDFSNHYSSFGSRLDRQRQSEFFLETWNKWADQLDIPIVMVAGNHDFFLAWPQFPGNCANWDFGRTHEPDEVPP